MEVGLHLRYPRHPRLAGGGCWIDVNGQIPDRVSGAEKEDHGSRGERG